MRECWNWQTGMTKDHVSVGSEGSSPFSRIIFMNNKSDGLVFFMFFFLLYLKKDEGEMYIVEKIR